MSTDLAVIEAALKAATPGPWKYEPPDGRHGGDPWIDADPMPVSEFYGTLADANLIANAPSWLAELVERVKVAEAAIERVRALAARLKAAGFTSVYESAQELGEMVADALDGDA